MYKYTAIQERGLATLGERFYLEQQRHSLPQLNLCMGMYCICLRILFYMRNLIFKHQKPIKIQINVKCFIYFYYLKIIPYSQRGYKMKVSSFFFSKNKSISINCHSSFFFSYSFSVSLNLYCRRLNVTFMSFENLNNFPDVFFSKFLFPSIFFMLISAGCGYIVIILVTLFTKHLNLDLCVRYSKCHFHLNQRDSRIVVSVNSIELFYFDDN